MNPPRLGPARGNAAALYPPIAAETAVSRLFDWASFDNGNSPAVTLRFGFTPAPLLDAPTMFDLDFGSR